MTIALELWQVPCPWITFKLMVLTFAQFVGYWWLATTMAPTRAADLRVANKQPGVVTTASRTQACQPLMASWPVMLAQLVMSRTLLGPPGPNALLEHWLRRLVPIP